MPERREREGRWTTPSGGRRAPASGAREGSRAPFPEPAHAGSASAAAFRATAEARLTRILHILPAASREGGASLQELAHALAVPESEVMRDIEDLTSRAYYHPAGSVEDIQILAERDRIRVFSVSRDFRRPHRLTPGETLALGLGLRALAAEAETEDDRQALLELTGRLEGALSVPDVLAPVVQAERAPPADRLLDRRGVAEAAEPYAPDLMAGDQREAGPAAVAGPFAVALEDDGFRAVVADAARDRRRCRIHYLKPGNKEAEARVIRPYVLLHAEGAWYVVAYDEGRQGTRTFRMDRMVDAELEAGSFDVPDDFDVSAYIAEGGRVFRAEDEVSVRVRYSPRVARWVAERVEVEPQPDGSVLATHAVADERWLVRHVLQYGPDAEVLEPATLRRLTARAASRASA